MHSPRSDEPIYWLLFGAGGMVVGIVLPAVILILLAAGVSSPDVATGLLSFEHVKSMLGNWLVSLCILGVISLTAWHAFPRIFHPLHDLTVPPSKLFWFALYGGAAAMTFICLALQFLIYCKLW